MINLLFTYYQHFVFQLFLKLIIFHTFSAIFPLCKEQQFGHYNGRTGEDISHTAVVNNNCIIILDLVHCNVAISDQVLLAVGRLQ